MSKPRQGTINVTTLINQLKENHSAFWKSSNGDDFANVTLWENDKPDQFGNIFSVQLNPKKDSQETKTYIANFKPAKES
jgi:hypothetical protein